MKCNNCGTEITPGMNECPYCRMPVNVLPTTPEAPTLPQDQNINITTETNLAQPIVTSADQVNTAQIAQPVEQVAPVVEQPINQVVEPVAPQPVAQPVQQQNVEQSMQPIVTSADQVNTTPIVDQTQVAQPVSQAATTPVEAIPTAVDQINGKLSSYDQAPIIKKEKKKKRMKVMLILLMVFIALGVAGFFLYQKLFNTGSDRNSLAIDKLLTRLNMFTNDNFELGSGEYTLNASLNYNDINYSTNVTGKYGYDLDNKVVDLTANINKLTLKNDEVISDTPLSSELYMYNNIVYILFQNFLNRYIYANLNEIPDSVAEISKNMIKDNTDDLVNSLREFDYDKLGLILNNISQNDIDYTMLIRSLKQAFKSSSSGMIVSQNISSSNPYNKLINITTLNFSQQRQKVFMNAFYMALSKNEPFIEDMIKLTGKNRDQILDMLSVKDDEFTPISDIKVNVFTSLFGQDLLGVGITYDNKDILISPKGLGYKIIIKENNTEVLNLEYTITTENTSATKRTERNVAFTYYENKIAYKGDITLETIATVNPKVEKVSTKNSVKFNNISRDNYKTLEKGFNEFGKFGLLAKEHIEYKNTIDYCNTAINCVLNPDGTSKCNYCIKTTDASGNEVENCNNTIICKK